MLGLLRLLTLCSATVHLRSVTFCLITHYLTQLSRCITFVNFGRRCSRCLFWLLWLPNWTLHQERDCVMLPLCLDCKSSSTESTPAALSSCKTPFILSFTSPPLLVSGWPDTESYLLTLFIYRSLSFIVSFALVANSHLMLPRKSARDFFIRAHEGRSKTNKGIIM
jgi:hypothetical protein